MNVKDVLKIQPNVSNQTQSVQMCAKRKKNNNSNKKRYAMLYYVSVYLSCKNSTLLCLEGRDNQ